MAVHEKGGADTARAGSERGRSDSPARMRAQIDRFLQKARLAAQLDSARGKVPEEDADRLAVLWVMNRVLAGLAREPGQLLK